MSIKKQTVKKDSPLSRVLAQRTGDWLKATVDDYLEQVVVPRRDPGWFHPSSLSHPCDAFLAFAYMGIQGKIKKSSARGIRILDNGTSRDEDVKRYLHESGASILKHWGGSDEERRLADEERSFEIPSLRIRGACDDIVANKLTGETFIHEFKTMNSEDWKKLRAPLESHRTQVQPYMFGHGILQCIITYENKDNQDWKQYQIRFDGALWHSIEVRLNNIVAMIEAKQMLWRTPVPYDDRCQFHWTCSGFMFAEEDNVSQEEA